MISARLYDLVMRGAETAGLARWREELLQQAQGDVLELGAGTGANLRSYGRDIRSVRLVEPDLRMRRALEARIPRDPPFPHDVVDAVAEELPFPDGSFDTVVSTLVLCSVTSQQRALREVRRVLRPAGRLLLIEHVASSETRVARTQRLLTPLWRHVADGCELDRHTLTELRDAGFDTTGVHRAELPVPVALLRPALRGCAVASL